MMTLRDERAREFAETARRYCAFIESASSTSLIERLRGARELLALLVYAASQLPQGDADGPEINDDVALPQDWVGFGEHDVCWEVFDPYEHEAPVAGSLSDDLLDVHRDLRRGLVAYDAGQQESALWEWEFHFDIHWGCRAVDALRALQRACRQFWDDR